MVVRCVKVRVPSSRKENPRGRKALGVGLHVGKNQCQLLYHLNDDKGIH